jgi:DNA-binding transcriptional regulator YdaS (Cro superfamily)
METLRDYINSLSTADQKQFADAAGTSIGFLRKAISVNQKLGEGICIRLVAASGGRLKPEDLRPDVDWQVIRDSEAA